MQTYFCGNQSMCKIYIFYILGSDVGAIPWRSYIKRYWFVLQGCFDLEAAWAVSELNDVRFMTKCLCLCYKFS